MVQGTSIVDDRIAEAEARGEAEGEALGKVKQARRMLTLFLRDRFGEIAPALEALIATADAAACEELLVLFVQTRPLREPSR